MRRRGNVFVVFFVCVVICVLLLFFSQRNLFGLNGLLEDVLLPLQRMTHGLVSGTPDEVVRLRIENAALSAQIAKQRDLIKENQALHDQFVTVEPQTKKLLPATVIGSPAFLPGISKVDQLIIDKGSDEGVKKGDVVVFKDNLVGKLTAILPHESIINLPTQSNIALAAVTSKTGALGVLRGQGADTMLLDNVTLSDTLQKGDLVQTKGDFDTHGGGYPSGLIIGKILAVAKKNSALFQTADVSSLLEFEKLTTVFVMQ